MRTFLIFVTSFVLCRFHLFAQTDVTKGSYPRVIKRKLFSIYTAVGLSQKAKINPESGEHRVTSTPQPVGEIGFNLQCDLNNDFFFITGLTGTITGRNAVFDVPIHQINPYSYPGSFPPMNISDVDFCATIPIEIEKRLATREI